MLEFSGGWCLIQCLFDGGSGRYDPQVEAFVHDPATLEYFFESVDRPSGVPSLMQMVIEGIGLPGSSTFSMKLKALAQHYMDMGPPPLTPEQIDRQRYAITDLLDDMRQPRSYLI